MTYQEAIRDSQVKTTEGMYPICFALLTQGLAALSLHLGQTLLMQDFPEVTMGGETIKGNHKTPDILSVMSLCLGNEFWAPRGAVFTYRWMEFVQWLLDEQIPEEDENGVIIWYDQETLVDKWNEFAKLNGN